MLCQRRLLPQLTWQHLCFLFWTTWLRSNDNGARLLPPTPAMLSQLSSANWIEAEFFCLLSDCVPFLRGLFTGFQLISWANLSICCCAACAFIHYYWHGMFWLSTGCVSMAISKLTMAALLLDNSRFSLASMLLLFQIHVVISMNY